MELKQNLLCRLCINSVSFWCFELFCATYEKQSLAVGLGGMHRVGCFGFRCWTLLIRGHTCTQANEFACLLQAALSFLRLCLFFGLISSWGYCLNVWTFKGCAGRLSAAKYLVEGITISAISKVPQTPALPLSVLQAGEGRRLCQQGLSLCTDSSNEKSEGPTCWCRGGEKQLLLPLTLAKLGSGG